MSPKKRPSKFRQPSTKQSIQSNKSMGPSILPIEFNSSSLPHMSSSSQETLDDKAVMDLAEEICQQSPDQLPSSDQSDQLEPVIPDNRRYHLVICSLGSVPSTKDYSTIDELRLAIASHIERTLPSDVRIFVFYGDRIPLSVSSADMLDPELLLPDGQHVRVLSSTSTQPDNSELESGVLLKSFEDETTEIVSDSTDSDFFT